MFCLIFINTAKISILVHLYDRVHNVVVCTASTHHAAQNKLGVFQQRIIINLVDGEL